MIDPLVLSYYTAVSSAGMGIAQFHDSLRNGRTGLHKCGFKYTPDLETYTGEVELIDDSPVKDQLAQYDCRNNRLAQLGLRQDGFDQQVARAKEKYGADRVAVIIGASTSGILETEIAYRNRSQEDGSLPDNFEFGKIHSIFSVADFTRKYLGLSGPLLSVATACSSSAKVFAIASRYIRAGLCDAAIVGGVDSLCQTTLYGFSSLELVAKHRCMPCDVNRNGINIGEAAAFALLEPVGSASGDCAKVALKGYGESSDAYHMSSPHPEGEGAQMAMRRALANANMGVADIDYINMHGTASKVNDSVEDKAVYKVFGDTVPCSSTKGWTGHTLGAAGALEVVISAICIENNLVLGSLNTSEVDPTFSSDIRLTTSEQKVDNVLTNSLGFGGSNCSLVLGRAS